MQFDDVKIASRILFVIFELRSIFDVTVVVLKIQFFLSWLLSTKLMVYFIKMCFFVCKNFRLLVKWPWLTPDKLKKV